MTSTDGYAIEPGELAMSEGLPSLCRELVDMSLDPDKAFAMRADELQPLRLAAAQQLFALRREQVALLRHRADEAGIGEIKSFDDIVPLLFAHTVYKSYPQQLFDKGRWDQMLRWLQSLSVSDLSNVDIDGVRDVDDWIERLWAAGHAVLATSGSSGKVSFLTHTMQDRALKTRHVRHVNTWPHIRPEPGRLVYWLGPIVGRNSAVEMAISNIENWGAPGKTFALDANPLRISEVSRTAAMRKRIASGDATPGEIRDYEASQAAKAVEAKEEMMRLADHIIDHRHEPLFIFGLWSQHLIIRDRARERGIADGEFHPQTVWFGGGGVKDVKLPDDYQEQAKAFYGPAIQFAIYSMTENAQTMPRCEKGRYHIPPGLILLMLDQAGEKVLGPEDGVDGLVEGRVGFLDLLYQGRWGGIISGDKAVMDHKDCACGRPGPTLLDTITRYAQTGESDHIGCAGTIDSYVRGGLSA